MSEDELQTIQLIKDGLNNAILETSLSLLETYRQK